MKRFKLIEYRGILSQKEMAKHYGVSQQTWACWENGKKTPRLPMLKKISDDIGEPMEAIFFDAFQHLKVVNGD